LAVFFYFAIQINPASGPKQKPMALIFLAFANDLAHPLPTLSREDEEVSRLLSMRSAKKHYALHRDPNTTLAKVAEYLIRYREEVAAFLFSGHAGRDRLILDGQAAKGEGIAELLGQCPKLKLVVLNGCSTVGQARQLLALPNKPAVIATSAPVEDFAATQFSISFFQALSEQYATLQEAFKLGLAAAKAAAQQELSVLDSRQLASRSEAGEPAWLLDTPQGEEGLLNWKLPGLPILAEEVEVKPNQFLLKGLLNSLAAFDAGVKEVMEDKHLTARVPGRRRLKKGDNEQRNVILKCLPLPISEQIEKLVAKRRENMHVFYDSFSYDRLKQLLLAYDIAMELPAFILLAQLFDLLAREEPKAKLSSTQAKVVQDFLSAPYEERLKKNYFPLIGTVMEVLAQNNIPLFVPEIAGLLPDNPSPFSTSRSVAKEGESLGPDAWRPEEAAFHGLELKKERLPRMGPLGMPEITRECIEAEEMLTLALSRLSFLASYSLVSVRNIDVLRNRLFRTPSFVHRVVHLAKKDTGEPEEVEELLDDFLDNESVLLMKKQPLTGHTRFLNLVPFVIDENAYVKKAETIKLHYFHHFQEAAGACFFKHTYKPEDPLLKIQYKETEEEEELAIQDVWAQFEDFRNLVQDAAL